MLAFSSIHEALDPLEVFDSIYSSSASRSVTTLVGRMYRCCHQTPTATTLLPCTSRASWIKIPGWIPAKPVGNTVAWLSAMFDAPMHRITTSRDLISDASSINLFFSPVRLFFGTEIIVSGGRDNGKNTVIKRDEYRAKEARRKDRVW